MNETLNTVNLADGLVRIQQHRDPEWLLVEIGRGRYVKRFNLRRSEAAQMVYHPAGSSRAEPLDVSC